MERPNSANHLQDVSGEVFLDVIVFYSHDSVRFWITGMPTRQEVTAILETSSQLFVEAARTPWFT